MRKFSLLLSTIVVLALLLTACGGQETTTSIPSTNVPPVTVESTGTEAPSATEAPTSAPGASDLTTTPGVPVTGENNPSRASTMIKMPLMDQNNTQVGQVQDLVLDLDNTRVAYLVVQVSGVGAAGNKTALVPWDSVQLQTSAANATSGQGNVFILLADPNFLNNAPDTDINTVLPGMGQPAGNWDADIRNFWATGAMPSTTQSANTPSAGNGTSTGGTSGNVAGATATATTGGTVTNATATSATAGTGNNQGQGQGQLQNAQGVVLASQVLGSTITFGGKGQGQAQATSAPDTTATATNATATTTTGGTGTGVGNAAGATEATVEDLIIDQATGDLRYLVIRTAEDNTRWIPIPIGFLRWDATNNGFVLMISTNALQNAPAFAEDQFPDTSTTGWDTEFSTFWQNNGGTGGAGGTGTGGTGGTSTTPTATP
jgi:sporulation protein YlmC with PRC-barrel domain